MSNTANTNPVKKDDELLDDPMLNLDKQEESENEADGYFDEDLDTSMDDLDLSFLDEEEDKEE